MKTTKLFTIVLLVLAVLLAQTGSVFAAPAALEGTTYTVTGLACGTTGTTVIVTYDDGDTTTPEAVVEVSLETAVTLGLIAPNTVCSDAVLAGGIGYTFTDPAVLVPAPPIQEEAQHPVGAALAAFFGDIADYDTIMEAHDSGVGFGVIAQALWMTMKLDGDSELFQKIVDAKKTGDYSGITLEDGSTPQNWGQFKKALLKQKGEEQKPNLGEIMSNKDKGTDNDKSNNGKGQDKDKNKDKDKDK